MKLLSIEKHTSAFFTKYKICFSGIKISFKVYIHFILYFKYLIFKYKYKRYTLRKNDGITRCLFLTNGNLNLINSMALINQLKLKENYENTLLVWTEADKKYQEEMRNISKFVPLKKYISLCNKSEDYTIKYFIDNQLSNYDKIYFTNGHALFNKIIKLYPNAEKNITDEGINPIYPASFIDYKQIKEIIFAKYINKIDWIGEKSLWGGGEFRELKKNEFLEISKQCEKLYPFDIDLNPEDKNIIFLGTFCSKKSSKYYTLEELFVWQNDIIEKLINKGYKVIFKPHPRDLYEYKENEKFKITKTKLPLECYDLKNKCLAVASIFSTASCTMYHYQNVAGFCATDLIKKAKDNVGFNIIKEYVPHINLLLNIDTKAKTFNQLREEILMEYLNFIKDKPLLSENKIIEKLFKKFRNIT